MVLSHGYHNQTRHDLKRLRQKIEAVAVAVLTTAKLPLESETATTNNTGYVRVRGGDVACSEKILIMFSSDA